MSVEERVHDLLAPVVETVGVELVDVEYTGSSLRVTIDEDSGITTGRLAEVNRLISPLLDQHDPISGRYTLEVSSPGLERPLRTVEHYQRAIDEVVVLKLAPDQEIRRLRGTLVGVEADGDHAVVVVIDTVEVDGVRLDESEERRVDQSTIVGARTVFEWGPSPKPGQPGSGKNKDKKSKASKNKASKNSQTPPEREVRDEQ